MKPSELEILKDIVLTSEKNSRINLDYIKDVSTYLKYALLSLKLTEIMDDNASSKVKEVVREHDKLLDVLVPVIEKILESSTNLDTTMQEHATYVHMLGQTQETIH